MVLLLEALLITISKMRSGADLSHDYRLLHARVRELSTHAAPLIVFNADPCKRQ